MHICNASELVTNSGDGREYAVTKLNEPRGRKWEARHEHHPPIKNSMD